MVDALPLAMGGEWPTGIGLLPPLVAIVLAVWTKRVILSLWIGCAVGFFLSSGGSGWFWIVEALGSPVRSLWAGGWSFDTDHIQVVAFTLLLGAMVAVISDAGGTLALVQRLAILTKTRNRTQMLTAALGLAVFFDDYANTLFVGSTMRPVTDRQRISREKLAFLVDATAAPVAGLAIISTWVGAEIGYIADAYASLGLTEDVYGVFLMTIPYRFYPVCLLLFVWLIAATGRDFGPMATVEANSLEHGVAEASPFDEQTPHPSEPEEPAGSALTALVPIGVLLLGMFGGLLGTGWASIATHNAVAAGQGEPLIDVTLWTMIDKSWPIEVLSVTSLLAFLTAMLMATVKDKVRVPRVLTSSLVGVRSMLPAILILLLSWTLAELCQHPNVNTAGTLLGVLEGDGLSSRIGGMLVTDYLPATIFVFSGLIAFAIGSSWSTMGLVMPVAIQLCYAVTLGEFDWYETVPPDPLPEFAVDALSYGSYMLATIGAVLAGAIFGDHCSPISDTTVLSSAASGCDHISHVGTQLPYACVVAGISIVCGYMPVGVANFPYAIWISLTVSLAATAAAVFVLGRKPDEKTE